MRRLVRVLVALLVLTAAALAAGGFWMRARLRASLPRIDGHHELSGLTGPVVVTRDALGIPRVRGASREDVARATGFLHAQDRFFQMDLARRRAAGELAALVGPAALEVDRETRRHRFRAEARHGVALMRSADRAILEGYSSGVNSGLDSLEAASWEYALLRQQPVPWRAEDSLLVVLSMFLTLQDSDGSYESTIATMHDVLPPVMFDFMASPGTEWDAPLVGGPFAVPEIPGPEVYDLRRRRAGRPRIDVPLRPETVRTPTIGSPAEALVAALAGISPVSEWDSGTRDGAEAIGSNSFAVDGRLTEDGGALLANDMHLTVRVPNTWYRAVLEWTEAGAEHTVTGVTLPGAPALVAGSNTHIAWGFTNTYADWSDVVLLDIDPSNPGRYRTPDGWRAFDEYDEVIQVAAGVDHHETVRWTVWGPVLEPDHRGRPRALRWVAHDAERLASASTPLERAWSIEAAFEQANGVGTPGQNLVVVDRAGRIAWSIYGAIPQRIGNVGRLPASWSDGTRGWQGWLDAAKYPRIVDPEGGRIWTANARVADGDMLTRLGDGGYEVGSRATIIRNRLNAKHRFNARDLLGIQLDTGADFLARWRDLLVRTLEAGGTASRDEHALLKEIMQDGWIGRASSDSAAYRFARLFREQVSERVISFLLSECYEADEEFRHTTLRRREGPVFKIVSERPLHLLDPAYESWDALLLDALDAVIAQASGAGDLRERVWSEYNVAVYRHPLSPSLPFVGRLLDMPRQPLPGDLFTPRVQWGSIAASERMIVSPGREDRGIMHMPTGQSGHPLSPFYANSHPAWVNGEPAPFLPGPARHTLTLTPPLRSGR